MFCNIPQINIFSNYDLFWIIVLIEQNWLDLKFTNRSLEDRCNKTVWLNKIMMKEDNHVDWGSYACKSGGQGTVKINDVETSVMIAIMALEMPWK